MNNRGQARGSPRGARFSKNRGQARGTPQGGRRTGDHPPHRHRPAGAGTCGPFPNDCPGSKELWSNSEMESPQQMSPGSFSYHSERKSAFRNAHRQEWHPSGRKDTLPCVESLKEGHKSTESASLKPKDLTCSVVPDSSDEGDFPSLSTLNHSRNSRLGLERMHIRETPSHMTGDGETSLPSKSEASSGAFPINSFVNTTGHRNPELSEHPAFDLCPTKSGSCVTLNPPLLVQNRERRNEMKRSKEKQNGSVLQPGMVLLKGFLSLSEQINIVKLCQDLGLGPGGFYQPGYRDGAKLNLKMMCLGKNWDPVTSKYGDHRPIDGAKPPTIPVEFFQLVEGVIKESHSLIRKDSKVSNSEDIFPRMSPDICLVNFYSSSGRLGLHQDRDESEQSLNKGLPVVSFSIGDTAEFLYGDQRDVERANKVLLESGDVLIFGGKSRLVFHGVESIQPNTGPRTLLEKTNIRAGRLNLTFRQY
ncbi:uncharacterized protein LOC117623233 isoform X2 [Prunus dulcis]|uniref:uncharacterized protein LOC117623233 isoform X2 n=1 Tax=Prunus dulcis TaxID=3755 RepID=UPI0014826DBF|nr:uncharacterized protein LOC117623233 isoform X2 [Prunus dulcis]